MHHRNNYDITIIIIHISIAHELGEMIDDQGHKRGGAYSHSRTITQQTNNRQRTHKKSCYINFNELTCNKLTPFGKEYNNNNNNNNNNGLIPVIELTSRLFNKYNTKVE